MSSSPDPEVTPRHAWFWWAHQSPFFNSFVRSREETSTHCLQISGYSTVTMVYKNGEGIESNPFRAGGHRWKLTYYPNGYLGSKTGSAAVALRLMDNRGFIGRAANVTAWLTLIVLDLGRNLLCARQPCKLRYKSRGSPGIWNDVVETATAMVEEGKAALRRLRDMPSSSGASSAWRGRRRSPD